MLTSHRHRSYMKLINLTLLLNLFFLCSTSLAQVPSPEEIHENLISDQAQDVYKQIWSPYCPGQSLYDCASAQSIHLRKEIALRIHNGQTKEDILNFIRDTFGPEMVMTPQKTGFAQSAWVIPGVLTVFFGLIVLVLFVRRQTNQSRQLTSMQPLQKDEISKVNQWLSK